MVEQGPTGGAQESLGNGDSPLMKRAGEIFFAVRALGLAEQEEAIGRECGGDAALEALVRLLLKGDDAPLPVEALADEVRAAHETGAPGAGPTVTAMGARAGSRIGHYKLLERIGEGGFGVVFMAEQERPVRRRVALKIIKLGMDTRQVVARFEAERQALAMMEHPNIARVFDAGSTETGRPYFVMELVRGLPITEYCDARRLDIRSRLGLFALICDAIQHAHQKGVIHRDIKPTNVLVTEIGERPVPKVIDFGIAKATSAELTDKTIFTEMRQMIGTPEYMSPEQASISALDIDTRSDVYSLGVLLYELLAGATPFDSARLRSAAYGEVQRIIREEDPPRPSKRLTTLGTRATIAAARGGLEPARLGSVLSGELDWVVMRCLEKDRSLRYDSAGSLMRDVERFIAGEEVQAVPPSAAYHLRKFVRRNKGPVAAVLLVAAALVAGLVGTSLGFGNALEQRNVARAEKGRADAKAREALAAEAVANRNAYSANMLSACSALEANQLSTARAFLAAAPPPLRGWEWRVASSRLDTSVRAVPCPIENWKPGRGTADNQLLPDPGGRSFVTVRSMEPDPAQQWDLQGRLLRRFPRPGRSLPKNTAVSRFVITPDGSRIGCFIFGNEAGEDGGVAVWDLASGESIGRMELPRVDGVEGTIALSNDLASAYRCAGDTILRQDLASGAIVARGAAYTKGPCDESPDGLLLATSDARGAVRLMNARSLTFLADLEGHKNILHDVCFSRDSHWLGTASIDGTARVWDLGTSPPSSIILEHPCAVECVRFSPDGAMIATGGRDGAIRVWDRVSGAMIGMYTGPQMIFGDVMFMPDGHTVAGRTQDGTVRFWDVTAQQTVDLRGHAGWLNAACFAGPSDMIVSAGWDGWIGSPGCVRFWNARTGDPIAAIGEKGQVAFHAAASADGRYAAAVLTAVESPWTRPEQIGRVRLVIVELATGRHQNVDIDTSATGECPLAFSPDGSVLVLSSPGRVELRRPPDGALIRAEEHRFEGLNCPSIAWSPTGRLIACTPAPTADLRAGRGVWLLDPTDLHVVRTLGSGAVPGITFSPDGRLVCAGSFEGTVSMYNTETGELVRTLEAHNERVASMAFSPNGDRLATVGSEEGDIIIWNTATWERVGRLHCDDFVAGAAWSSDGTRLIGACGRTIRIWDAVPLRDRVAWRDASRAAMARVEPLVGELLSKIHDPVAVAAAIERDSSLDATSRSAALDQLFKNVLTAPAPSHNGGE